MKPNKTKRAAQKTAIRCYQCFSLQCLLANATWLKNNKKVQWSFVNCGGQHFNTELYKVQKVQKKFN